MDGVEKYLSKTIEWLVTALPQLALAIGVLFIGLWIVKRLTKVLSATLQKSGFAIEIASFLVTVANVGLKVLLMISVAGMVGVNTAAFVGVLAAGGLAIGLALQGSLGNFAAGIIIVTFKPYKSGDWVEIKEKFGKVTDIQIFNTILVTPGNKTLIIPNGEVIGGVITNFSKIGNIRIELKAWLPYSEDFTRTKQLIIEHLLSMPKVLKDPVPYVGIEEFGPLNIVLSIRPYVDPDDYWEVYYDVMAGLKRLYHENGIGVNYADGFDTGKVGP